jgi:hypothetical protein
MGRGTNGLKMGCLTNPGNPIGGLTNPGGNPMGGLTNPGGTPTGRMEVVPIVAAGAVPTITALASLLIKRAAPISTMVQIMRNSIYRFIVFISFPVAYALAQFTTF